MVRLLPFVVCLVSLWVVYLLVAYVGKTLPLVEKERDPFISTSEMHNLDSVSGRDQFEEVKNKTLKSHISEYGDKLTKINNTESASNCSHRISSREFDELEERYRSISQKEVGLMMVWLKYMRSSCSERVEALEEIRMILKDRARVDFQVEMIGVLLFGSEDAHSILYSKRKLELPLVDDFDCLMSRGRFFEKYCGGLNEYGYKHLRSFANICNRLVAKEAYETAVLDTCGTKVVTSDFSFP